MIRRRVAIGLGLGTLLAVGSASVALDLKSRDDAALVDHTMEVLQKSSDLRLLLRQVESASRAFAMPAPTSLATTALARPSDRAWLCAAAPVPSV